MSTTRCLLSVQGTKYTEGSRRCRQVGPKASASTSERDFLVGETRKREDSPPMRFRKRVSLSEGKTSQNPVTAAWQSKTLNGNVSTRNQIKNNNKEVALDAG